MAIQPVRGFRCVALLVVATAWVGQIGAEAQEMPALFESVDAQRPLTRSLGSRSEVESRAVHVRTDLLRARRRGATIRLDLFGGASAVATRLRAGEDGRGNLTWTGAVDGVAGAAVFGDAVAGTIRHGADTFSLRYRAGVGHLLHRIDLSLLPGDRDDVDLMPDSISPVAPSVGSSARADTLIDLLVLYTGAAKKAIGNKSAVEALALLGATETNIALTDSKVKRAAFRVVKVQKIAYKEGATMVVDLDFLKVFGDGTLDKAWRSRNKFGADLVMLIVDGVDPDRCGRANKPNGVGAAFVNSVFSIVRYDCVSPNYSYAHELGHNTGLNHGRKDGESSPGAFDYSFGLHDPGGLFRTIMATSTGGREPRVLHFSNPKVKEQGNSTGVKHTRADSADNARSLRNVFQTLSDYRDCKVDC